MASVPTSGSAPPPPVWDARPRQASVVRYAGFWLRVVAWIVDMYRAARSCRQVISPFFPPPPPTAGERRGGRALAGIRWTGISPGKIFVGTLIGWAYFDSQERSGAGEARQTAARRPGLDRGTARG